MTAEQGNRVVQPKRNRDIGGNPELWAIRRTLDLCGLGHQRGHAERAASRSRVLRTVARYIEQHEEPPLHPLEAATCEVVASSDEVMQPVEGRLPVTEIS